MKDFKIDNKGSKELFENKILERLTRTHFAFPVILYFGVSVASALYAVLSTNRIWIYYVSLFIAGLIIFTFVEYLIHRFLFHFKTSTAKQVQLQYNIHGVHHEFPRDKDRLVMPPVLSVFVAFLFYFIFRLLTGENALILFSGFTAGYSTYLVIHYAVHALRPPQNFLKYLWKHHSLHHYSSTESAFSVSFPFWDFLFGTMPKKEVSKLNRS